jgi:methyl-accepting chemotaxis protein
MRERLHNLSIVARLWLVIGVGAIGALVLAYGSFRVVASRMLRERETKVRAVVETADGVLATYARLVSAGKMTEEEARRTALELLRQTRYEGREYVWVNDLEPRMVMHPTRPELDGKDLSGEVDPNGKRLFVEFVKTVKGSGAGYVDYLWPKPGSVAPVPKISYVKLFEPWGWVVGSGLYLDDLDAAAADEGRKVLGAAALVLLRWRAACSCSGGASPARSERPCTPPRSSPTDASTSSWRDRGRARRGGSSRPWS